MFIGNKVTERLKITERQAEDSMKMDIKEVGIKEMPLGERPRERMLKNGPKALSDAELLAILIRTGTKEGSALTIARRILRERDLKDISKLSVPELRKNRGIGNAKACQIATAFELGRRIEKHNGKRINRIKTAEDVVKIVGPELRVMSKESFRILCLNSKNGLIKDEEISIGSLNANVVHPREVYKAAINESAAAIILVHNHPSGDPNPSQDDIELTKTISAAGDLLNIKVLDHIIIGDGKFVSLKEKGLF